MIIKNTPTLKIYKLTKEQYKSRLEAGLIEEDALYLTPDTTPDNDYYSSSEIDSMFSSKSDIGHTHDDRYYTEPEIDIKLNDKSDVGHTHAADSALSSTSTNPVQNKVINEAITSLEAAIEGKVDANELSSHIGDTMVHVTSNERTNWNAAKAHADSAHAPANAEANQNAFSNVIVGDKTITADTKTDSLMFNAGDNVTLTANESEDAITISSTIPVATTGNVGGIKSGGDVTVDSSGNVSVTNVDASVIIGTISETNLPSYVDDVVEYNNKNNFPTEGESGKIYVDTSTNLTYRWSGSTYVEISPSLALGTTDSTAYRGDLGAAAYAHAVTNKGGAFASGLYKIATNAEGHVTSASAVEKADITALGIPASDTHHQSKNVVASSATATSNTTSEIANGDVYLNSVENGAIRSSHNIVGLGATEVTAGSDGSVFVYSPNVNAPVTTSGSGAAYTATVDDIKELTIGATFIMLPHTQSTTISPTLNVNGLGAKTIRQPLTNSTSSTTSAANTNWLGANKPVRVTYNGTFWVADLVRPNAANLYGVTAIEHGGTGADNATDARVNLGIETINGTTTSGNADYAEVGEWVDGNPNDEDRIGYFVTIDENTSGTTMVKANSLSDVRGVTVAAPAFSGNCASHKFETETKTETDPETGDVVTKIISTNLKKQYDYVAVMGIVSVIDNGTCTINGRCMPNDAGTAVPSHNNMGYQVIDRIDSTHVLIAVEPGADMLVRIKQDVTELEDGKSDIGHKHNVSDIINVTAGSYLVGNGTSGLKEKTPEQLYADIQSLVQAEIEKAIGIAINGSY